MAAGLSNADFRALLATPRRGGGPALGGGEAAEQQKKKQQHKKPGGRPGGKPGGKTAGKPAAEGEDGEAVDEGPQYRDRAAERRKGFSADFEGVPDDLVGLLEGQANLRGLSYEDSKYLGGDVAHTHLVKGLDFALLHKVRAEQDQDGSKRPAGLGVGPEGGEEGGAKVLAKKVEVGGPQAAAATFHTALGRSVHSFFFDPKQRGLGVAPADLFLPRRTAFVYELDGGEAGAGTDIPTTLRRSKEDCPKVKEMALGGLDGGVLDKLARIMAYMTVQGGGKKKLKKKERHALLQRHGIALQGPVKGGGGGGEEGVAAAGDGEHGFGGGEGEEQHGAAAPGGQAAAAAAAADDDDIFGDAGTDYQPTVKDKKKAAVAAAAAAAAAHEQQEQEGQQEGKRRGGYFGAGGVEDLHADLPPLPREHEGGAPPLPAEEGELQGPSAGPMRPPSGYDPAAAYAPHPDAEAVYGAAGGVAAAAAAGEEVAAAARTERSKEKRRAADVLGGGDDDAYAECYPSYYDMGVTVEDSDEEGGGPPEAQQATLTRRDFDNDADWEEHQAAGQAPTRQAEGRAKVRQQQRVASKEKNKISSQLGKIQKIMEDKGYDHTTAFVKAQRERGGGGGEGGGEGGASETPVFTKKRRI